MIIIQIWVANNKILYFKYQNIRLLQSIISQNKCDIENQFAQNFRYYLIFSNELLETKGKLISFLLIFLKTFYVLKLYT